MAFWSTCNEKVFYGGVYTAVQSDVISWKVSLRIYVYLKALKMVVCAFAGYFAGYFVWGTVSQGFNYVVCQIDQI